MIKHLIFFRNGNVWASDEQGAQVAEEQEPAWWIVLQDKLNRGVIDKDTLVTREHYCDLTVAEIVRARAAFENGPIFSTRERKGGIIIKDGKINIEWKASEQLLPAETAQFREGLANLCRRFQTAGAQIAVATFVDGGAEPVNLVETTAASHAG